MRQSTICNWKNQEAWENEDGWIPVDDQNVLDTQPQLHTSQWIDWVFDHASIHQIKEITEHLFAQNFRTQFEEANKYPFHTDTLHPSIPELEESPVKEQQQDQWEICKRDPRSW